MESPSITENHGSVQPPTMIPQQNPPEGKENTPETEALDPSIFFLKPIDEEKCLREKSPEQEPVEVINLEKNETSEAGPSAVTLPEEKPADQEKKEETKTTNASKLQKPPRRRSSIGMQLAKAFLNPDTEDIMSPVEVKVRPKRALPIKPPPLPALSGVVRRKPTVRYSFDLGERVAMKSCLKPSKGPVLIRPNLIAPPPKSRTQQTAKKVVEKYRRTSGLDPKTPRRPRKLKFHKICSIRVITPRPDYNPDKLNFCSDDEADMSRQRLSTVELQLTPTSQAKLDEMRETDVLQFNASMVFGDGDASLSGDDATDTAVEDTAFVEDTEKEAKRKVVEVKKKVSSRRKSVILGAAAPLKSPAKIERARDDEVTEDPVDSVEPSRARKSRRSVRLNPDVIEKPDEPDVDVVLHEREKESKKKRDHVPDEAPIEPDPKRSRRKSGFIKPDKEVPLEKEKKKEERSKPIHSFFAPKQSKKEEKKIEETKKESQKSEEAIRKERKRNRRSSAYFGSADVSRKNSSDDDIEIIVPSPSEATTSSPSESIIATTSSSSSSTLKLDEVLPSSPKISKVLPMFAKSPITTKKVFEIKHNVESTSSTTSSPSTSSAKLFSLFSPKPKPKVDTVVEPSEKTISLSDSPLIRVDNSRKTLGVKRQEHWGDVCPESYEFMLKMTPQPSIFDGETFDENLFKSRADDENILRMEAVNSELREVDWKDPDLLAADRTQKVEIEKLEVPENCCPTTVFPPKMSYLVEGAEEEEVIYGWLKKWKRRVRKDREREMAEEKQKKNGLLAKRGQRGQAKRGRRKNDDEDEDDGDYELDGREDDLENPLVLIGPTGVGKTALIKALAKQSNMRIISIGPEEDRSGAEIKKKLHEAIRSHRVDQQPDRGISMFYKKAPESIFVPKNSQPPKDFVQSLVVFEHVDVFFEGMDRYGINGLLEIVNNSAVPIIFTCENDWPRSSFSVELKRRSLEVRLGRNEVKVQKYVQRLIYSCRNVSIDDSTIRKLSESVNHDLQGLLHQAHLFSLASTKSMPLTSRYFTSNGFEQEWEKPREAWTPKHDRMHELMEQYSDVLPDGIISTIHPRVEKLWDETRRELGNEQAARQESVRNAYEAMRGRHSVKELILDVLPLLVPIDRVERQKRARNRRHLHRFKHGDMTSNVDGYPMDGEVLSDVVGGWSINRH